MRPWASLLSSALPGAGLFRIASPPAPKRDCGVVCDRRLQLKRRRQESIRKRIRKLRGGRFGARLRPSHCVQLVDSLSMRFTYGPGLAEDAGVTRQHPSGGTEWEEYDCSRTQAHGTGKSGCVPEDLPIIQQDKRCRVRSSTEHGGECT